MQTTPLYDYSPVALMALVGVLLSLAPLAWVSYRHRGQGLSAWLKALTVLTLFLTFDLVLFGAFTRLTDSGLGCPDWPGCYGNASPLGAHAEITAAQTALPSGPVTHGKAWVEMVHRYFATGIGVLITVLLMTTLYEVGRLRSQISPWWAVVTWFWVCLQGAFGAWTVTMKLYPAIVTGHLLGGYGLLMLLAAQSQGYLKQPLALPTGLRRLAWGVLLLTIAQATLGGWVSTNYAVLACADFPTCHGLWWPKMDFEHGFAILRPLGLGHDGQALSFAGLVAIHVVHRLGAAVLTLAVGTLIWLLYRTGAPALRRWAVVLGAALLWQLLSGLSNVVLGWPMLAALAHTGGAGALLTLLTILLARAAQRAPSSP